VLGDALGRAGDLLHGRQRAAQEEKAPARDDDDGHGQSHRQLSQHVPEDRLREIQRLAGLDEVDRPVRRLVAQRLHNHRFAPLQLDHAGCLGFRGARRGRDLRGIEVTVAGLAGDVEHRAVFAGDPEEAAVGLGGERILGQLAEGLPGRLHVPEQGVGDLVGAAELADERVPQVQVQKHAKRREDRGQQPDAPEDEAEADRAGVHAGGTSPRL